MKLNFKFALVFILSSMITLSAFSQIVQPATWKVEFSKKDVKVGETLEVLIKAEIKDTWHVYSNDFDPELGPIVATFNFEKNDSYELVGEVKAIKPLKHFDEVWDGEVSYFEKTAEFRQTIKVLNENLKITGAFEYQACSDVDGSCVSGEEDFDLVLNNNSKAEEAIVADVKDSSTKETKEERNYFSIFILAFLGGFAALLTPCVFPMIPMTVSFFTKQSKTKAQGIKNALIYGLSIVIIYVILGTVVTAVFGADSLNSLSTDPWFNLFFAILLFVFAFSFMGAFEIVLPHKWVNAVDQKADKGGVIGIFFMASALALVSFSCTGPIVGSLIVEAARSGGLAPVVGMLGFSLALAIPFALFAAFPGWLNSLPKSGGWLNSVKVILGFLEFAFAFKFLSIADMVLDLHILEREMFISIWIATFLALALYLWGKLRLPHDSPMEYISVSRFVSGIIVFGFVIYMIPGLWGAPVKLISGFPPPVDYAESPLGVGKTSLAGTSESSQDVNPQKHIGPHGIPLFEDYDVALAYAKEVGKPLLIDFTGKGCTNCRKMEDNVWVDPLVKKMFLEDFVIVSLYVDLRIKLPKSKQYISKTTGKKIKTIGNKWSDFQISRFNRNTQPYYVVLDHNEKEVIEGKGYDASAENFIKFLDEGLKKFKN